MKKQDRWKTPYRPKESQISQSFCDGVVDIYRVVDTAEPGYQPKLMLRKKGTLHFSSLRMGYRRYYMAQQAQIKIEHVLRVCNGFPISTQDRAKIRGIDAQYRIDLVQKVDGIYPACVDLTLVRVEQAMEAAGGDADGVE